MACWGVDYWTGDKSLLAGTFVSASVGGGPTAGEHTCGIRETGTVACWGTDWSGRTTPPPGAFVSVSAGVRHTCGIRDTGDVACWGNDMFGQSTPPEDAFVSVSAGEYHTCGIRDTGILDCWGGEWRHCYRDDTGTVVCPVREFGRQTTTPPEGTFVSVSAGRYHTCGIRDTGAVACWGADGHGQSTPPAGTFVSVSAGEGHTCGIRDTGAVACWGWDGYGQSTPPADGTADLVVVELPSEIENPRSAGESFGFRATVRNQGATRSAATTLRWYLSSDAKISPSDTEVGTRPVNGLAAFGKSRVWLSMTAPSTADRYYYGACVDAVPGESNTLNNCSAGVQVAVSVAPDAIYGIGRIPQSMVKLTREEMQRRFVLAEITESHARKVGDIACKSYIQSGHCDSQAGRFRSPDGTVRTETGTAPFTKIVHYPSGNHSQWTVDEMAKMPEVKIVVRTSGIELVYRGYGNFLPYLVIQSARQRRQQRSVVRHADQCGGQGRGREAHRGWTADYRRRMGQGYEGQLCSSRRGVLLRRGRRPGRLCLDAVRFPLSKRVVAPASLHPSSPRHWHRCCPSVPDTTPENLARLGKACVKKRGEGIEALLRTSGGIGVADFGCIDTIIAALANLPDGGTASIHINGHPVTVNAREIVVRSPGGS